MRISGAKDFPKILDSPIINLKLLREQCLRGCPEDTEVRATVWKILLNHLPLHTSLWEDRLSKTREEYASLAVELTNTNDSPSQSTDHPLSCDPNSSWREYFHDNTVIVQINKDCRRLYPELDFFRRTTEFPSNLAVSPDLSISALRQRVTTELTRSHAVAANTLGAIKLVNGEIGRSLLAACKQSLPEPPEVDQSSDDLPSNLEAHWEVVQRIIFIYYKVNHGSSYVQGMNEIVGPIYYVFANHPDPVERRYAEHDTFFCFNNLMAEIHNNFDRHFDQDFGIGSKMEEMFRLLRQFDSDLLDHLTHLQLEPAHFAFRWITLLLSREFLLPDVLRIWDCIFADEKRFDLVLYICCSMLIFIRKELMACDFPHMIRLLQNYPYADVGCIISHALGLYKNDGKI